MAGVLFYAPRWCLELVKGLDVWREPGRHTFLLDVVTLQFPDVLLKDSIKVVRAL